MNYILREYGSWSVLLLSYISGIVIAGKMDLDIILPLIGLCFFVNSKQAFVIWHRLLRREAFFVFILQIVLGLLILFVAEGGSIFRLYPFALIPLIYLLSLILLTEHSIFTEIAGFLTLCLASQIAFFSLSGGMDIRLYLALSLFFIAGIFKVRLQLKKAIEERALMIAYLTVSIISYLLFELNPLILLPLIENLIFAFSLYRVRLQTTGWIEVVKGVLFLVLLYFLW